MVGLETDRVAGVGDAGQVVGHGQVDATVELEARPALAQDDRVERRVGERLGGHQVGGMPKHLDGRPELGYAPFRHGRGIAPEQQRLMRLRRGVDEDRAGRREQLRQFLAQFLAQLVVEVGQRLVQQDEGRILDDGARQGCSLLLSAGQAERRTVEIGRELQERGRAGDLPLDRGFIGAGHPQRRGDVLVYGHRRIVDELLVDHRDVALLHRHARDVGPVEPNRPAGRGVETRHKPHQAGLAGQGGPEQDVERTVAKRQRNVADVIHAGHRLRYIPQFEHHASSRAATLPNPSQAADPVAAASPPRRTGGLLFGRRAVQRPHALHVVFKHRGLL